VLIGCAIAPPIRPSGAVEIQGSTVGVIALVGTVGAMSLVDGDASGSLQPMGDAGLPPDAAWLSSDGRTLLVTTLAGGTMVGAASGPGAGSAGSSGRIAWSPASGDLAGTHPLRAFGSLWPAPAPGLAPGTDPVQIAFDEGDPGSGGAGRIVIETVTGTEVQRFDLPRAAESPAAWLPDGRIVVIVRDRTDSSVALVLDPRTGRVTPARSGPLRSIAVAGQLVATIDADGLVRVGPVSAWLGGQPGSAIPVASGVEPVLQAQPSVTGDELALVVADPHGDASSIRILAAVGGWHEIARFGLPRGANRAVVSWLVAR
jgi:hypothetical protein